MKLKRSSLILIAVGVVVLGSIAVLAFAGVNLGIYPTLGSGSVTSTITSTSAFGVTTTTSTSSSFTGQRSLTNVAQYCAAYEAYFGVSYCPIAAGGGGANTGMNLISFVLYPTWLLSLGALGYADVRLLIVLGLGAMILLVGLFLAPSKKRRKRS